MGLVKDLKTRCDAEAAEGKGKNEAAIVE